MAHAGESVELMVSTTEAHVGLPARAACGTATAIPAGPGFKIEEVRPELAGAGLPGGLQDTHVGSFAQAPPVPDLAASRRVQLRLWAQPTLVGDGRRQVLLSSHDARRRPGLRARADGREGRFELAVGARAVELPEPARAGVWCRITAELDAEEGALRLAVRRAHGLPARERLGEEERVERPVGGLDLGFAGPVLSWRRARPRSAAARSASAITTTASSRRRRSSRRAPPGTSCAASRGWDLGDGVAGDRAPDRGPGACHARLINGPRGP